MNFYNVTNIFDQLILTMKQRSFQNFGKFTGKCILFLYFFLNERNITTSLLMVHLTCTVMHYSNLNSNSINKLFLDYRQFFDFFHYVYFKGFVKNFMKKFSFFNINFQN